MKSFKCHFSFKAMGCVNEVQFFCGGLEKSQRACDKLLDTVLKLEAKYSRFRPDTIVSRINENAGKLPTELDSETSSLLSYADECYKMSGGLFDLTCGVLRKIWDFKRGVVPADSQIRETRELIGWSKIKLSKKDIFLPYVGMEIDLGGLVKEFAADRAAGVLQEAGIKCGLINLGGDIHVIGPKSAQEPWQIGVAHPRQESGAIASVPLIRGALATSGDYERYFISDGIRYCHILNPITGRPVHDLQSVTVCSNSCLVSGTLSTVTMLLGKDRGIQLLEESELHYLVVDSEGEITHRGPFTGF